MLMTKRELARVARNVEASIKDVMSIDDVKARVGRDPDGACVDDAHGGEEYLEVMAHPASPGAFVIQYMLRTGQNPLQVVVNLAGSYIRIMLTCTDALHGYSIFEGALSFGKVQDKSLAFDFGALHEELAQLAKLR